MPGASRPAFTSGRYHTLRESENSVQAAAEYLGLTEQQVRAAVDYYADFTDEVDQYRADQAEFERAHRMLA